ncbi:DUF975 family protein [Schaedlerella arabinosiphila]|uniref:DUF975 family protein n=1 Tax=Schaedlerella arabinosiphila TaxID=2044587 RepID=A0A426DPC6_9FIRM|nr:DUF975 family protein [Schaedlerella arabinosiphila]RRK34551.1 DUF975 family protein [Schaedlerella arabinosiphila]
MRTRKEIRKNLKARAKKILKKHYWLFLLLCIVSSILGGGSVLTSSGMNDPEADASLTTATSYSAVITSFLEFMVEITEDSVESQEQKIRETEARYVEDSLINPRAVLGRSRGVLASVVNKVSSGAYLMTLVLGIRSLAGTDSGTVIILLVGALALMFLLEIFVVGVYRTVMLRMFLEGRCYEKVPAQRLWFLLRVKKWCHVGIARFVTGILSLLWGLTLVGGIIKAYSYYLVPYILAENPGIKTMDAITLSRKLMNGHKWECFVLELSFFGWDLLGVLTLGLSNIFFTAPYKAAVLAEYYAELRRLGRERETEHIDLLNDTYLFENADPLMLEFTYSDVYEEYGRKLPDTAQLKGIQRILAEVFGVTVRRSQAIETLETEQSLRFQLEYDKKASESLVYPTRLYPIPEHKKRKWIASQNYLRYYSVWSVILIFFTLSFAGWVWEVSLHLITDGEFANRGVMHGPWLPIYGCGSVMILLLLNKFRRKPAVEFVLAMLLCGCVEYFTSLFLESLHGGTRWWDYTGYFLNLQGRICAEGLLTFGIGGMAIVYVLVPFLDGLFRKLPVRALIITACILSAAFAVDQVYSLKYPNEGKGITDFQEVTVSGTAVNIFDF